VNWSGHAHRALLPVVAAMVAAGGVATIAGAGRAAEVVWSTAVAVVAIQLGVVTVTRLREGRIAVDVVALLALVGALGLGELVAGAVTALMVASGDALEQYAHHRVDESEVYPSVAAALTGE
jgi:hypothetical protein